MSAFSAYVKSPIVYGSTIVNGAFPYCDASCSTAARHLLPSTGNDTNRSLHFSFLLFSLFMPHRVICDYTFLYNKSLLQCPVPTIKVCTMNSGPPCIYISCLYLHLPLLFNLLIFNHFLNRIKKSLIHFFISQYVKLQHSRVLRPLFLIKRFSVYSIT